LVVTIGEFILQYFFLRSVSYGTFGDCRLDGGIEFAHVSDGLPEDHPRLAGNLMQYVMAVYSMEPGINTLLSELHETAPITCLVRDVHLPFQFKAVRDAGISIAAFAPNSAINEHLNRKVRALIDGGYLPNTGSEKEQTIDWDRLITTIDGVPPQLRVGDLPLWPSVKGNLHAKVVDSIENRTKQYVLSDWVIINTVYELESSTIDAMRTLTPNITTCGPLSLLDHHDEAKSDIDWLNHQPPGSVLIIAFGTTTLRSIDQFYEVALGLEASQQRFLWVFSPEQVPSSDPSERERFLSFMAAFGERTRDRGYITRWVSRFLATLKHAAIGAFLSHCGWHSVLEGITSGTPFLTWPFQYDHWPVARCVTHVWRVGLGVEEGEGGLVGRDEVERKVRRILGEEDAEVDAIRVRSEALRSVAEKAVAKGGSSQLSLASFVADVTKKVNS
jgi:hypothetical protein